MSEEIEKKEKKKRKAYHKDMPQFQDEELQDQMYEQWDKIQAMDIDQLQKAKLIDAKYKQKLRKKRLEENRERIEDGSIRPQVKNNTTIEVDYQKHIYELEPGEIKEVEKEPEILPTVNNFGNHIKSLILTRAKLQDLLNLPRFEQIIRGCFIRYHCSKINNYAIAQIISTVQSNSKTYKLGKVQTNLLLRLQISANEIQNLSMTIVSNQPVSGVLQINRWFDSNRDKLPSVSDLVKKKQQLQKDTMTEISAQDINKNIMRNIEKVVKKQRQIRQDLSSYLSFLNQRDHHIQYQIKYLQQQHHADQQPQQKGDRQRRGGRFGRQYNEKPKIKITQTKQQLIEQRNKIKQYIQKLKQMRQIQIQKKQQKKQLNKPKIEKLYDTRVQRQDIIANKIRERIRDLSTSSQVNKVYAEIINDHISHPLKINLKL